MSDRTLVLGAGGFIGRHLVRALAQGGNSVIAVSRSQVDFGLANVEAVIGEPREPDQFAQLLARSRAVVHLASTTTPGSSAARPVHEVADNLLPLASLLQAMQRRPEIELLYLSSGGSLYTASSDVAADEMTRVQPRSYHGAGKIAAEYFISAWCHQYSGRAMILRPSNVYGPGQPERAGFGIVPACLGRIRRGETLQVWGDGSAIRDYLYIDDLVQLMMAILARPMSTGAGIINACSGVGISLNELFAAMEIATGRPLLRAYETSRPVDATSVTMDHALASRQYHWSPATSLEEGLRKTWAWLNDTQH